MILDAPLQVRRAILLLWLTWVLGAISTAVSMIGAEGGEVWIVLGIAFLFYAFLIHRASCRGRWSRLLLAALILGGLVVSLYPFEEPIEMEYWEWFERLATSAMEAVALFWLFTGPGARWYRREATA